MLKILMMVVAVGLVTGCASAIVSGNATGGYGEGSDGRTRQQQTEDAAITSRVNARLLNDATTGRYTIDVATVSGVVTLSGPVPATAARRAVELAAATRGVKRVVSRLR